MEDKDNRDGNRIVAGCELDGSLIKARWKLD